MCYVYKGILRTTTTSKSFKSRVSHGSTNNIVTEHNIKSIESCDRKYSNCIISSKKTPRNKRLPTVLQNKILTERGYLDFKFRQITGLRFPTWKKIANRVLFGAEYLVEAGLNINCQATSNWCSIHASY